jgi:hypothetical protein
MNVTAGPSPASMPTAARAHVLTRAYGALAVVAVAVTVGVWLLLVVDDDRSLLRATADLVLTFTNLTTMLVAVVAGLTAWARPRPPWVGLGHLMVTVMVVATALVNAVLLDAALPAGWWGVVDLFQHYLIPVAVVALWALIGPRFELTWSRLPLVFVVPIAWLVLTLVRGGMTDEYPYDFLEVDENGWVSVLGMVGGLLALMIGLAAALLAIDHRREGER